MKIIDQVASILKHDPASRNSDKRLFLIYAQKCGLNLSPEQIKVFYRMPSFETIRRRRQYLQEQGLYPADEAVDEKRYKNFQAMQNGIDTDRQAQSSNAEYTAAMSAFPAPAKIYKPVEWGEE